MSGSKPLAFLSVPSYDGPMVLNISRLHGNERMELTEGQVCNWQFLIAEYQMIRAQRKYTKEAQDKRTEWEKRNALI